MRSRLGLTSLVFEGVTWQLVAKPPGKAGAELGNYYFWHPYSNKEARTLPDLTWVEASPPMLPGTSLQAMRRNIFV